MSEGKQVVMVEKCYLCGQEITDEKIGCACETVAPTCDTENPEMCESCQ